MTELLTLAKNIQHWGHELGFQQIAICDTNLFTYEKKFTQWLENHFHGEMEWMASHGKKRTHPEDLIPGTKSIIIGRMNYLPPNTDILKTLKSPTQAYVSRYAVGRDYHKLIRKRMNQLAKKIESDIGDFNHRPFSDSAPILEKPLAEKAGLGWIGKNTLLINRDAGSWFFLGVLYTNLNLPNTDPIKNHCGNCQACIDVCPTNAIVAPYQLDARRCISYLTIEHRGSIPEKFRSLIGNRVYGCDDCQLVCPWNRFAKFTNEKDFHPRHQLTNAKLVELFAWNENDFLTKTEGSAIRRIGYECWLRNIAIALGNAPRTKEVIAALESRCNNPSPLVREHVAWALAKHQRKITSSEKACDNVAIR